MLKWLVFIITLTSRIDDILPQEQKALLTADDKILIEYIFDKFKLTNTRADIQLQEEGVSLIDKLLDRQTKIGLLTS